VIVHAVVDHSLSPTSPLGDAVETFIRREDAERFIEKVPATIPGFGVSAARRPQRRTTRRPPQFS
jgi:hypothetical protein